MLNVKCRYFDILKVLENFQKGFKKVFGTFLMFLNLFQEALKCWFKKGSKVGPSGLPRYNSQL